MANYHLEINIISRGKGRSVIKAASYISGEKLHDDYAEQTYYNKRRDVFQWKLFLPSNAPSCFHNLQYFCNAIEQAERRYDARTAREFKGSLPNELTFHEHAQIVEEYVEKNFVSYGLCALAAIHEGRNETDPSRDNPHVHIIVSTRTIDRNGFNRKKERCLDRKANINIWRKSWADVQNRAYERNGLDIHVSHESLEVQGIDHEPTIHLSRIDWQKEKCGERTIAGDKKRAIEERNKDRIYQRQAGVERTYELGLSR